MSDSKPPHASPPVAGPGEQVLPAASGEQAAPLGNTTPQATFGDPAPLQPPPIERAALGTPGAYVAPADGLATQPVAPSEQMPPAEVMAMPMGASTTGPVPGGPIAVESPSAPSTMNLVIGPVMWICGALLWSYVVLGELVIEAKFPEALAWLLMAAAYAGAWLRAIRPGRLLHRLGPGIFGFLSFVFMLLFVTSLFGSHRRSAAAAVAVAVLLLGVALFYAGRAFTSAPKVELHTAHRAYLIIGWVIIWGTTGLVLVSLVD